MQNGKRYDTPAFSAVLLCHQDGFQPAHNITLGSLSNNAPFPDGVPSGAYLAAADFNSDGYPDVFAFFAPSGGSTQADVLLTGTGTAWVDSMKVELDGEPTTTRSSISTSSPHGEGRLH